VLNVKFHQKIILLNKDTKFLTLKAAYKGLKWDLPGGAVDLPELHLEAILREVKEDLASALQRQGQWTLGLPTVRARTPTTSL
jgi:ADP-ribose pyrophosphatase YjhB (NUDIX family)